MATTAAEAGFNANTRPASGVRMPSSRNWPSQGTEQPFHRIMRAAQKYAHENPESACLWCFGIGFILGWKLKP